MKCEQATDLWMLFVAGGLDDAERREMERHLVSGCPRCAGARSEAEATLAEIPLALDPLPPPPALRARLLERVVAETVPRTGNRWLRPAIGLGIAAMLTLAVSVAVLGDRQTRLREQLASQEGRILELQTKADRAGELDLLVARQAEQIRELETADGETTGLLAEVERQRLEIGRLQDTEMLLATKNAEIDRLRRALDERSRLVALYRDPHSQVIPLEGTIDAFGASGRILQDADGSRWLFSARGLEPPGMSKTYQLWFITDEKIVSAGTFDVDRNGDAEIDVRVPTGLGRILVAAVTDEPVGGSIQPSGRIRLKGELPAETS